MAARPPRLRVVIPEPVAGLLAPTLTAPVTVVAAASASDADLAPHLADADVLISNRFTAAMAAATTHLRLIQATGAGTELIDPSALPPDAAVCNMFGHETSIAEYVMMAMLALNRDLIGMDRRLHAGDWRDSDTLRPQRDLFGRVVAIVGYGHIGAAVARYATAFGMEVRVATRNVGCHARDDLPLAYLGPLSDLRAVLAPADFVVIALPLTAETTDLFGDAEFAMMRPSACLINVARARIVNEAALFAALERGVVAGAAIDVWYRYPEGSGPTLPSRYPFHTLPNVIMTPHVSGWTETTMRRRWAAIDENLRRLGSGEPLLNVVARGGGPPVTIVDPGIWTVRGRRSS
jgi:phosphoglycerate dehydrogenase-like enzyme